MDCKPLICELMNELKAARLSFIEEQMTWRGIDKNEVNKAVKALQERGVICLKVNGMIELTKPLNT